MATAVGNVLLNISTGKTDFASIKGFVDLMGQAISVVANFAKKNDAYVDAMQKMTVSVDKAVQATGSLIDTQKLMATTAKLSMAGIKFTEDQFRNLAVAAADMGEITGDAAGALDALTTAVISGNERGLKPYGISLEGATTRTEKQAKALEELSKKFNGVTVEADTLSDGFEGLWKAGTDLIGAVWNAQYSRDTGFLGWLNDVTKDCARTASAIRNVGITGGIAIAQIEKGAANTAKGKMGGGLSLGFGALLNLWSGNANLMQEEEAAKAYQQKQRDEKLRKEIENQSEEARALLEADLQANRELIEEERQRGPAAKAKGGGGGSKKAKALDAYTAAALGLDFPKRTGPDMASTRYGDEQKAFRSGSTIEGDLFAAGGGGELPFEQGGISQVIDMENAAMEKQIALMWQRYETQQRWNAVIDEGIGKASDFNKSIGSYLKGMTAGTMAANAATQGLRGALTQVFEAAIMGNKLTAHAMAEMVRGVGMSIAIEASLRSIMAGAMAIAALARDDYKGAALWGENAGQMAVVAGIATAVAAGAQYLVGNGGETTSGSPALRNRSSETSGAEGQWNPGAPSGGGSSSGNVQVSVTLEGDAEGIFKVTKKGSRRSQANGSGGFAEAM
jgi:hypothetical protein